MNKSYYISKIGKYENISEVPDKQAYEWVKTEHWDFKIFKFWVENKKEEIFIVAKQERIDIYDDDREIVIKGAFRNKPENVFSLDVYKTTLKNNYE